MKLLKPEFQHEDNRRTLKQLFTAPVKQVNIFQAKQGAILGNHFHKETIEYFHVVRGSIIYNDTQVICKGMSFKVDPGEIHRIECVTDVTLMTFLSKPYTKEEPDTYV